jgi:hypothetical protein
MRDSRISTEVFPEPGFVGIIPKEEHDEKTG